MKTQSPKHGLAVLSIVSGVLGLVWCAIGICFAVFHVIHGSTNGWVGLGLVVYFSVPSGLLSLIGGIIPHSVIPESEKGRALGLALALSAFLCALSLGIYGMSQHGGG